MTRSKVQKQHFSALFISSTFDLQKCAQRKSGTVSAKLMSAALSLCDVARTKSGHGAQFLKIGNFAAFKRGRLQNCARRAF